MKRTQNSSKDAQNAENSSEEQKRFASAAQIQTEYQEIKCLYCEKKTLIHKKKPKEPNYNYATWLYCTTCKRYQLKMRDKNGKKEEVVERNSKGIYDDSRQMCLEKEDM